MYGKKERGISLVEILIVVVILAILAAILIPVTIRAKERAKVAGCVTNLSQIATATTLYVADYDNVLPPNIPGLGQPTNLWYTKRWSEQIYPYSKSNEIIFCPSDTYKNKVIDFESPQRGMMVDSSYSGWYGDGWELGSNNTFTCPLDAVKNPAEESYISDQIRVKRTLLPNNSAKLEEFTVHGKTYSTLFLDWHVKHTACPWTMKQGS